MGGSGSGFQGIARPDTDGAARLDVRWLERERIVVPGTSVSTTMTWDRNGTPVASIGVYSDGGRRLVLTYAVRRPGEPDRTDVREVVAIERTPCRFGGSRPWLVCPACRRRSAVLWMADGWFRCRLCHGLAYSSTRDSALDRANRRVGKLRTRLGLPPQAPWPLYGVYFKPPRMHFRTYERIVSELMTLTREREAILDTEFARLVARTDRILANAAREARGWRPKRSTDRRNPSCGSDGGSVRSRPAPGAAR